MAQTYRITDEMLEGTVFDKTNPTSLINVVPTRVVPVLERMRHRLPRVMSTPECHLRLALKPDDRDDKIRLNFWDEYNISTNVGKRMSLFNIIRGVMSAETWNTVYEPSNRKMMWVLCQPTSYNVAMRNILQVATDRLLEIIKLPIYDDKGKPDTKVIVNILRAFQLVDMRVKGGVVQNLMIKQQSHHLHQSLNSDSHIPLAGVGQKPVSLDTLDIGELEKLERRISAARKDAKRLAETVNMLPDNTTVRPQIRSLENDEIFKDTFLMEPIDNDPAKEDE